MRHAPLAQLDRASGYGPEGQEFESLAACQESLETVMVSRLFFVRDKENHWLCQWKQRAYSDDESKKKSLRFEVRKVFRPDLQQFGDYFMTNKKLTNRKRRQVENCARLRAVGQVMQAKESSVRLETLASIMPF